MKDGKSFANNDLRVDEKVAHLWINQPPTVLVWSVPVGIFNQSTICKIAWLCKIHTIWTPVVFLHYSDIYMVRFPNPLAFGLTKVSRGPCLHLHNFVNVIIDKRHFVEHFNGLQVAFKNDLA